ncbi:MAG: M64 family metallopeptidase, partial [Eudoraea sp.]|nr:M64 family metallopeptidase [Eudoraea sp.]
YTVADCITDWHRTHDAIDYYMADFDSPEIQLREVALNSDEHFGSVHYPQRGLLNTYSAGNPYTINIFLHENGHMAGMLADEYVTDEDEVYTGGEPSNVNITTVLNPLKWEDWVGYDQPYSYSDNSLIGAYEGAKYVGKGIYRPSEQCMMNRYTNPFCAVCREKIILDMYREIRPVDSLHIDFPEVSLQLIDPDLFNVIWYVEEVQLASGILSFDLDTFGLEQGKHTLRAVVSDKILEHSNTGSYFDWVRRDTLLLKQEISRDIVVE